MKIYNYDRETKEFLNENEATPNPKKEGKFLIPANATSIKTLIAKDGFTVYFNEELKQWEYKEDNRTKIVYDITDKTESKVDYLGVIKDGFTLLKPKEFDKWESNKWVENIADKNQFVKTTRISEIDARFKEIESEKMRPMSSIKIAELKEIKPDEYDVTKLFSLEDETNTLRIERSSLT